MPRLTLALSAAPTDGQAVQAPAPPARLPVPPLLVGHRQAAELCGIGRSTWHRLLAAGKVGPTPIKLGGRVLVNTEELRDWCRAGCPDRQEWLARRAARDNGRT